MSTGRQWNTYVIERLKPAILAMCSHRCLRDRLTLSKKLIIPLRIEDFPPEHAHQARIILEKSLYKFDNSQNEAEVTATDEEIDTYARSLFELYFSVLQYLSTHNPRSFEIWTTPEYKMEEEE